MWKVSSNYVCGDTVYHVYRVLNPGEPDHSGNRVTVGSYESREEAQDEADRMNREEAGDHDG